MAEVSGRALLFLRAAEARRLCRVDELVAGLPLAQAAIGDAEAWIPWTVFAQLCERFGSRFPNEDALAAAAALSTDVSPWPATASAPLSDPAELKRLLLDWAAPELYRCASLGLTRNSEALALSLELVGDARGCRPWFVMIAGVLQQGLRLWGVGDRVSSESDDKRLRLAVRTSSSEVPDGHEKTMRALADVGGDLVLRFRNDLVLVDVVQGFSSGGSGWGVPVSALVGMHFDDVVAAVRVPELARLAETTDRARAAMVAGERLEQRLPLIDAVGLPREFDVITAPIRGTAESVIIVKETTTRAAAEREMAAAERRGTLSAMSAGVAHEINNPLTYLTLGVQLIRREVDGLASEARDAIAPLLDDLERGHETIRSTVATLKRIAPGPHQEQQAKIEEGIAAARLLTAHAIRHRANLEVGNTAGSTGLTHSELVQVLTKLIDRAANAITQRKEREGPEGAPGTIRLETEESDTSVVIKVSDDGIAPAADILDHLVEPGDNSEGFALTIVQRVIADADGDVDVVREGGRTTFRLKLPRRAAPAAQPVAITRSETPALAVKAANAQQNTQRAPTVRVWIIDDEPLLGRTLKRVLAHHDVTVFTDGDSALLKLYGSGPADVPNVIFCDIMMAGLSGPALYDRVLRSMPEVAPRLIFLTGGAFTDEAQAFAKREDIRLLAKPIEAATLDEEIDRVVAGQKRDGASPSPT